MVNEQTINKDSFTLVTSRRKKNRANLQNISRETAPDFAINLDESVVDEDLVLR